MTQHDDDKAASPPPATGILVTIDEAHAAAERLGDDTTVAELLRSIILAGRDVRVMIEPPMPATLEQIAAGLDEAGRLMQVRAVLARWRPIRDQVTIPGHYIAELFDGVQKAAGDPPAPRQYEATTQHDLMVEIIKAAGAAGALPGQITAEMVRTGRAWGRRSELYPALDKAQKDGLVVQPLTHGRYYWHECAPAGDAIAEAIAGIPRPGSAEQSPGGSLDVAIAELAAHTAVAGDVDLHRPHVRVLLREIMGSDGVDEREAAHRLLERAGIPRPDAPAGGEQLPALEDDEDQR